MFPRSIDNNRLERHSDLRAVPQHFAPQHTTEQQLAQQQLVKRWLGDLSLAETGHWPDQANSVAIVSSHSERNGFESPRWQSKLALAIRYVQDHGHTVLLNQRSPYGPLLAEACRRADVPFIAVDAGARPLAQGTWSIAGDHETLLWLDLNNLPDGSARQHPAAMIDRFLIAIAAQVIALQVRAHGKICALLEERLASPDIERTTVKVLLAEREAAHWLDRGAVGWTSPALLNKDRRARIGDVDSLCARKCDGLSTSKNTEKYTHQPSIPLRLMSRTGDAPRYLTHCTRARCGRWPDQTQTEYLQEVLGSGGVAAQGPLESLMRILRMKELLATRERKPGRCASVSFSAKPLPELLSGRRFEKHLGRWDWEPYGVCIKLDALAARGARPVRYRTKAEMFHLSNDEAKISQVYAETTDGRDWRIEQEWRLFGHCQLDSFAPEELFVFVATAADSKAIEHLSRWPILVAQHRSSRVRTNDCH